MSGRAGTLLVGLLVLGCHLPGQPKPGDHAPPAPQVRSFDILYKQNCAGCHGADGKLGPAPPLNDPLFLAIVPDEVLHQIIIEGRPGTLMTAFARDKGGTLTDEQVAILADGLKPRWGQPQQSSAPPYLHQAGGNWQEGQKAFDRACAGCHGDAGQGMTHKGRLMRKINDPAFLSLSSDQVLRRYVITGRPDLHMPDYATATGRSDGFQPLTAAEVSDLVALLAHWRQSHDK